MGKLQGKIKLIINLDYSAQVVYCIFQYGKEAQVDFTIKIGSKNSEQLNRGYYSRWNFIFTSLSNSEGWISSTLQTFSSVV
jgi:hypothetical protein